MEPNHCRRLFNIRRWKKWPSRCQFHQKKLYERYFGSFFYVHVTREKLPKQCSYKKFVLQVRLENKVVFCGHIFLWTYFFVDIFFNGEPTLLVHCWGIVDIRCCNFITKGPQALKHHLYFMLQKKLAITVKDSTIVCEMRPCRKLISNIKKLMKYLWVHLSTY